MKKTTVLLTILLFLAAGCANYVTTSELANRLHGQVNADDAPQRAIITGSGHEVIVESGSPLVFVDGEPILLRNRSRVEYGMLKVSDEVYKFLPATPAVAGEQPAQRRRPALNNIVVDAGHGGRDLGASYAGVHEKTVNLDISRKLAVELRRHGVNVTLTRNSDTFIPLDERSAIANTRGADLFVSIHANAGRGGNPVPHGIEVYHLAPTFTHRGHRHDDASRAVELTARHRAAGNVRPQITPSLLARRRRESRSLANHIEHAMAQGLGVASRGVKQADFSVLKWTQAPAVLVEVGFLSNTADRRRLASAPYRRRVAHAIAEGILSYRESLEQGN